MRVSFCFFCNHFLLLHPPITYVITTCTFSCPPPPSPNAASSSTVLKPAPPKNTLSDSLKKLNLDSESHHSFVILKNTIFNVSIKFLKLVLFFSSLLRMVKANLRIMHNL